MQIQNFSQQDILNLYKKELGVEFPGLNPVVTDSNRDYTEKFLNAFENRQTMAMDVDTFTYNHPSNGFPFWATMINANVLVEQLLPIRQYEKISTPMQQGDWTTESVYYANVAPIGQTQPYGDYSTTGESDVNVTFPNRDIFRGQTNIQYGELEVAKAAKVNLDLVSQKRAAAMVNIKVATNKLFFYGNINLSGAFIAHTYGLLNDPQLNPAVPATNGGSGSPLWSVKFQSPNGPRDIANDVLVTSWKAMLEQTGGQVDLNTPMILICSTSAAAYLNTPNEFGLNPTILIKNTMPNIEFIFAPEYEALGSFQLIAMRTNQQTNGDLIRDLFSYKLRSHPLVTQSSSFREKFSFGSGGAAILQYASIVTVSGIE